MTETIERKDGDTAQPDWVAHPDRFAQRHLGPGLAAQAQMLEALEAPSLAALADAAVPTAIRLACPLELPQPASESEALAELRAIASRNQVYRSYLGLGYHDCITPPVIQRNLFENPGLYTQYTPYQAEISQGRLEGLLNFQTMVCDLTGMEIANASLLDEATAAAEAMHLCHGLKGAEGRDTFVVAADCHPQTLAVIRTRAKALGLRVHVCAPEAIACDGSVFGVLVQYPATDGVVRDYTRLVEAAHAASTFVVVAADLLSLSLLRPPGEFGADVVVGNAQRFGVPLGYGGPHAAFFATRDAFKRQMPGRLVGVSKDARGKPALRLSLQTREQHIRREKATSNICTAQALLANMASMYAVYHGPEGLRRIARRVHLMACVLAAGLRRLGCQAGDAPFFDTLRVGLETQTSAEVIRLAEAHRINLRALDERTIVVALDETTSLADVTELLRVFNRDAAPALDLGELVRAAGSGGGIIRRRIGACRASSRAPCSTGTTRRPRCSATSAGSRPGTSRSPPR